MMIKPVLMALRPSFFKKEKGWGFYGVVPQQLRADMLLQRT